ncbi:STAS domain-containing protein [Thermocoleostomius sinensis A174]|uniref:Anti-sigma factor antagonist n=1 Tax=Thermocoleostomius sinensis A174 TaxID=2016057 RepID=A0A9E8ZAG7_9CYAN|nr:STAS domain-containing protein [Thermocoleostomius sinensis A174]
MLDAYSEQAFLKALEKFSEENPKNIILDLSQIDFIDSSGIGALVKLAKKVQNNGGTFQTVTNPRVTQTVKLVRLEQFLSLQPTVEDALAKLKQSS